jgi:hypothetical protein
MYILVKSLSGNKSYPLIVPILARRDANDGLDTLFLYLYLYEYVEDTNTGFNSTGERAPIAGVGEQI